MISVKLDAHSLYQVRWPHKDPEIIALGEAYVARELSLPASARVAAPALSLVQAALLAAKTPAVTAVKAEQDRIEASEAYRQDLLQIKKDLNMALVHLKSKYLSNLGKLAHWGLEVVYTQRGLSVRKPKTDKAWFAFAQAYVAQENSLPLNEQITQPDLTSLNARVAQMTQNQAVRENGRNTREAGIQARSEKVQELLDYLQVAALVISIVRFDRRVTNDLQLWGYQVLAVTPPAPSEPPPTAEPTAVA